MWMLLALLSSACYAGMAVIDKRLIDRYMPNIGTYYVWVGAAVFVYGVAFLWVEGIPEFSPVGHVLMAVLSGLIWGCAVAMMFLGFKMQEVSRASAVIFTFPVFVAIFAVMFLGETLEPMQWGAIGVVVLGAAMISLTGQTGAGGRGNLAKAMPVLMAASLLTAGGHITGKYALEELSVWLVTALHFLSVGVVLLVFTRPGMVFHFRQIVRSKEAVILLIASEVLLAPAAILLLIAATKLGPVSLVATLTATRPIMVVLLVAALSLPGLRMMNESLNKGVLAVKLASVSMIVGGIVFI